MRTLIENAAGGQAHARPLLHTRVLNGLINEYRNVA